MNISSEYKEIIKEEKCSTLEELTFDETAQTEKCQPWFDALPGIIIDEIKNERYWSFDKLKGICKIFNMIYKDEIRITYLRRTIMLFLDSVENFTYDKDNNCLHIICNKSFIQEVVSICYCFGYDLTNQSENELTFVLSDKNRKVYKKNKYLNINNNKEIKEVFIVDSGRMNKIDDQYKSIVCSLKHNKFGLDMTINGKDILYVYEMNDICYCVLYDLNRLKFNVRCLESSYPYPHKDLPHSSENKQELINN